MTVWDTRRGQEFLDRIPSTLRRIETRLEAIDNSGKTLEQAILSLAEAIKEKNNQIQSLMSLLTEERSNNE